MQLLTDKIDALRVRSGGAASYRHSRATSMLTAIQSDLLLIELPVQAVCEANSSVYHVHTVVQHGVHPHRVRPTQLSQPERARQLHICERCQNLSVPDWHGTCMWIISIKRKMSPLRNTYISSRSLCRSMQGHCQEEAKQHPTLMAPNLACICSAGRALVRRPCCLSLACCRWQSTGMALRRPKADFCAHRSRWRQ